MQALVFIVVSLCGFHISDGQSAEDVQLIHKMLDNNTISPYVRPQKNVSRPTALNISFHLVAIVDFNAASHRLTSSALLTVAWQDDYLTWEPAAYGGITRILPDPTQLWRPRLTIRNTLTDMKVLDHSYMVARYDGMMKWLPIETFETFCHVDVTYFPFELQKCRWEMFLWAEDESVDLNPVQSGVVLDSYVGDGEWKVTSTAVRRVTSHLDDAPFSVLVYEVTLRRRPALVVMTIVLPLFILAGLNVFVFIIPHESGARLSFATTSLLSYGIFLASVVNLLPGSVKTLSILVIGMSVFLILSAIYSLISVVFMRLCCREDARRVQEKLQAVTRRLERLVHVTVSDLTATQKPQPGQARTGTDDRMTWKRAVRSLDALLFIFFFVLVLSSIAILWTLVVIH
ncbi:acetylcholine receptor subunit alpha-1-A-like [Pomacea canaliculata]|uniref:acetylcholine receptor subunit alpha-1-A-like n=1 Tax=Pomacea canaliculata TaxID=400727 RepID=UPI000D73192B|nr:acetylcholine receptor subunit alpha-1-A-like [Pomacea canaliculata]